MKQRNKLILIGSMTITLCVVSFSTAFGLYNTTENKVMVNISGSQSSVSYQISYKYPSNADNGTFTTQTVAVDENEVLINHAPNTNNISISNAGPSGKNNGTYTFEGWYTDSGYSTKLTSSTLVTANQAVYAKYICVNTLHYYDGSNQVYTTSNATDLVINASSCEYGSRILGYSINPSDDVDNYAWHGSHTSVPLTSSSGLYKITKNGTTNWKIERKIGMKAKPSFWYDANARTYVYCSGASGLSNSYSSSWMYDWNSSIYVDARYTSFLYQRFDPNGNAPTGSTKITAWTDAPKTITLNGFNDYSSTKIYAMINDGNSNMAWVDENTNDMPY